jgi:UDP-glucose 4-epimerase
MSIFLVTGAAGFIGSCLARRLITEGNQVVTIDNLSTGFIDAIPHGVIFFKGNCYDDSIIKKLKAYNFDAIFHIAGQSSGEISFDDPVYDLKSNTQSTLQLLKLALKVKCKKFIYASTMSVYGVQPDRPVSEEDEATPISIYAVGKLASENYMRIFQQYGLQTTALRLFNVYGEGQNLLNLKQGMVSIYLALALKNKHILVKGSPDRYRDLIYIDDVVDAFICAYNRDGCDDKIYNVATGEKTTVACLIAKIINILNEDISVEYSGTTPGDQFGIYGDFSKIKNELGWYPKINLNEGLSRTIKWAKSKNFN